MEKELKEVVEKPIKIDLPKTLVELNADKSTFDLDGMTHRAKVRYNAKFVEDTETYAKFEGKDVILIFRKV